MNLKVNRNLQYKIIKALSENYPFGYDEIETTYLVLRRSFDLTRLALDLSLSMNIDLNYSTEIIGKSLDTP